ncbi:MAG: hypothetical protein HQL67_07640 [Magnetococcales bacterium]|nr:hypothetical protein [Magnetococcales bacterium]
MAKSDEALNDFKENRVLYLEFIDTFRSLVQVSIAKEKQIGVVQITGHLKSIDRLRQEIDALPDGRYPILSDFKNLMVLRLVTFYEKDVTLALNCLMDTFELVDSAIKPHPDDAEKIGYPGSALVLKLDKNRIKLDEYQRFSGFVIEVQIYSLFQDTWSKIQRHIGYSADSFPKEYLREYMHLAYMLELADSELNNIRGNLDQWEILQDKIKGNKTRASARFNLTESGNLEFSAVESKKSPKTIEVKELAVEAPAKVATPAAKIFLPSIEKITRIPLIATPELITLENVDDFILSNELARNFDKLISDTYNTRLMYQAKNAEPLFQSLATFKLFKTLANIEKQLYKKRQELLALGIHIFGDPDKNQHEFIPKGIALFLLSYYTISETEEDLAKVSEFLDRYSFNRELVNGQSVPW